MVQMFMVVKLRGHDTPLQMDGDRKDLYSWVVEHMPDIEYMDIYCGLNRWAWLEHVGWLQYTQVKYDPIRSIHRVEANPRRRGNRHDSLHPWRFTFMPEGKMTPNPMWPMTPIF